jgi:hypothetical protein
MSDRLWRRVHHGLAQYAQQRGINPHRVLKVVRTLNQIQSFCGDATQSRKGLYRLGCALLEPQPHIFVPICPDYSHMDGKYTYRGLGSGVPLVFMKHWPFLNRVVHLVPCVCVTILIADHEGELPDFRQSLGVTLKKFRASVRGTRKAIKQIVPKSWSVFLFTKMFPRFLDQTLTRAQSLLADPDFANSLRADAILRGRLYQMLGYPPESWIDRTAHVAGQYLCLGEAVVAQNAIVCNHSTTSLRWYRQVHAAILHNPVTIY